VIFLFFSFSFGFSGSFLALFLASLLTFSVAGYARVFLFILSVWQTAQSKSLGLWLRCSCSSAAFNFFYCFIYFFGAVVGRAAGISSSLSFYSFNCTLLR